MKKEFIFVFTFFLFMNYPATCGNRIDSLKYQNEVHLKNIKQFTFGGNNAEAYFSFNDSIIVFQSDFKAWGVDCDQIFQMDINSIKPDHNLVSTGMGRTTCSYFMPANNQIIYASTHLGGKNCPDVPERFIDGKYVWPIYSTYDIFLSNLNGIILKQFTNIEGYDAEATVSADGKKIVFTSVRSGDLELWIMNIDGSDPKQITNQLGYDGGAFFSPDSKKIVFRASRPKTVEEINSYKSFLNKNLVQPSQLEIFTCDTDGTNLKQITNLGKANWAPFFHPSGEKIIFASNHHAERGYQFNLFIINIDGTGLEQITFDKSFDSFPMFSFDGKKLIFSSNRFNGGTHDTNIFISDWVD